MLLGIHDLDLGETLCSIFERAGYPTDLVLSVEEMLAKIEQKEYGRYIMDVNLGNRDSPDIGPAIKVYRAIKPQVESQRAKFLGITGNEDAVRAAQEIDIPVLQKQSKLYQLLLEFLKET